MQINKIIDVKIFIKLHTDIDFLPKWNGNSKVNNIQNMILNQ